MPNFVLKRTRMGLGEDEPKAARFDPGEHPRSGTSAQIESQNLTKLHRTLARSRRFFSRPSAVQLNDLRRVNLLRRLQ